MCRSDHESSHCSNLCMIRTGTTLTVHICIQQYGIVHWATQYEVSPARFLQHMQHGEITVSSIKKEDVI